MGIIDFSASDAQRGADGTAGFKVHPEMQATLDRTGDYIKDSEGGQKLRQLYREGCISTFGQNSSKLKQFAFDCWFGQVAEVKRAVESGRAPDLTGTETPYKFGYCTLVIAGAQRGADAFPNADHIATIKYLISSGAPKDSSDIAGLTALHHATMSIEGPTLALVRILLESGRGIFVNTGPTITAAVTKWLRKWSGEQKPLYGKTCAKCGKTDVTLKLCSQCHAIKYCSLGCQRADWRAHKTTCKPFNAATSVTVRPTYRDMGSLMSVSAFTRQTIGVSTAPRPNTHSRSVHVPLIKSGQPKAMVIKVQVPNTGKAPSKAPSMDDGPMLIYDKKRELVCALDAAENETAYMRIATTIFTKGVGGAKAYFPAELKSKDELVIKVSEVLAEQPF